MWVVKFLGEGVVLVDVCEVMVVVMVVLGVVVDGGKDFFSMVVWVGIEIVWVFGLLVILVYVVCLDIIVIVILDFKYFEGRGYLFYVVLSFGQYWFGGIVLVQCFFQFGEYFLDLDFFENLVWVFSIIQGLLKDCFFCLGYDVSDGGFVICLLEMVFVGNCGLQVDVFVFRVDVLFVLFVEELGFVLEVQELDLVQVLKCYWDVGFYCLELGYIGEVGFYVMVWVLVNGVVVLEEFVGEL